MFKISAAPPAVPLATREISLVGFSAIAAAEMCEVGVEETAGLV